MLNSKVGNYGRRERIKLNEKEMEENVKGMWDEG